MVDAFFDKYDLLDHHIKSYNDFVSKRIQNIIEFTDEISLENGKYKVRTGKLTIKKPFTKEADGSKTDIFPTEARLRNLNYSAHMFLEMALDEEGQPESEFENVYIGELPVMLKSEICHLDGLDKEQLVNEGEDPQDPGGYFIVNGSERAVVTMEEIAPNKIILERMGEVEDRHANCLNILAWDGTERIRYALHHFLGAEVSEYSYEALKLFMLGAITRAFKPGNKFEIMLCLVGGQGAGKSTFFRLLALRDEWFSDDLRKLDDENVYRKLQGHWIIEMSEMMATANAKSIEEIKSFLSRQKEVYKIPYETHPADRPRQCVFGGTSNALDFLPLDRSGNRRFIPVMVYPEQAEVHILEDEAASRAYIRQMWAEAMEIYRSGNFKLKFSPEMAKYLKEHQRDFMPEDTKAGQIQAYLDKYTGDTVCSKQLYKEALNHAFDEPKQWEIREVNEIMNQCISGWRYFSNPRMFAGFGRQKGWEREVAATDNGNQPGNIPAGFVEITEQIELPF